MNMTMNSSIAEPAVRSGNPVPAAATDFVASFHAMPLIEPGLDCDDAQAQIELAMALQQAGNLAGAVTAYAHAIALRPEWPHAYAMLGIALQAMGQVDDAIGALRQSLQLAPDEAQTWSNLGVLEQQRGRSAEAIDALHNALRLQPRLTEAHANLGVILRLQGRLDEAIEAFRYALALRPNYAEAHANLGVCFNQLGRSEDAASALRVATILKPEYAEAHADLGRVMMALGRPGDAAVACRTAISLGMETSDNYLSMGVALQELGQADDAIAAYQRAIDLAPDCADAWSNLGVVLLEQTLHDKAINAFRRAAALNPSHPHAFANLSIALHERGDDEQAAQCFEQAVRLNPDDADVYSNFAMVRIHQHRFDDALQLLVKAADLNQNHGRQLDESTTVPFCRIKHDCEQMALLRQRGLLAPAFEDYADALDELSMSRPLVADSTKGLPMDTAMLSRIAPSYNRLVHVPVAAPAALNGPCLNPQLDIVQLERAYLESRPEVVWVDDFLSQPTLEAIRQFCDEATVWKKEYPNGYLGATLKDGFASPLILRIAEELRLAFPAIFGRNLLEQAWAFKYDSTMRGINVHADFAAVNVNFWITREQACLDPERGGLVIWDVEAPRDWSFQQYNGDEGQIRRFLSESGAKSIRVPYRENRCVMFNSTLFHETDRFAFNDAYQDRRINVTLLYGKGLKMR